MASQGSLAKAKYKILCLHGIGTNSDVFEAQTAPLRSQLGNEFEYDFIDGSYPWPAARGIEEMFGSRQIYYSYFDESPESFSKAVDDLSKYVTKMGPFDAVMGFSQGASLAAALLLRNEVKIQTDMLQSDAVPLSRQVQSLRSAIFLSGLPPANLEGGTESFLEANDIEATIQVPTVHAWSSTDTESPGKSADLVQMCDPSRRIEVVHKAGHSVPLRGDDLLNTVNAIKRNMASLVYSEIAMQ